MSRCRSAILGCSSGYVVPYPKIAEQHRDLSKTPSASQTRLEKEVGRAVRSPSFRRPDKPKSQALGSSGHKAQPVPPRNQQGCKGKISLSPLGGTGPLDETGILDGTGAFCSSDQPSPLLDGRVLRGLGSGRRPSKKLEGSMVGRGRGPAHQRSGASHHTIRSKVNKPKESKPGSVVGQPNGDKCHPKIRLSLPRLAKAGRPPHQGNGAAENSSRTKTHRGKTERGGRRSLARGGNSGRMGTVGRDVPELSGPTRDLPAGGHVRVPSQPQTPGLLLPVSVPSVSGPGRPGSGLEPVLSSPNISAAQPGWRDGKEADRIQGVGGVLVIQDSAALLRLIPARFLA